jgi:glycosyltransferase involved in cell wall biosynthesis
MVKRIKILFTIPNFDTAGSGKVVYDLVKGLDHARFEPEICCFHNKGSYFKIIEELGVRIHLFKFTTPYRPFLSFPFRLFKIYQFFKTHHFDVIHSWHWSSDFTEPLAAKLAGIPFVYTKKAMGWGNKSWRWRSQLSTKIICVNSEMAPAFYTKLLNKVEFIPLGIDITNFSPNFNSGLKRYQFNLDQKDFVVITVANLVPIKGIEVLTKAINLFNDDNIKLLIVGDYDNPYGIALKKEFEGQNIMFVGKQLDVKSFLALADVFVISTIGIGEGLPIAPLEAMAMGQVVIGSKVSGVTDILSPFPEMLFDPGNSHDLKEKIVNVKNLNRKERIDLGIKMTNYISKDYSLGDSVAKHEQLYKKLLE